MDRLRRWLAGITPRQILLAALAIFLCYAWPGFIGWDTREHFLQARTGVYTDGHPPAVAHLVRLCELFVTGPAPLLLIQAVTLLVGLNLVFRRRMTPRAAALSAAGVFLFPFVAGVTALITKDALMAGPMMIGIGLLLDERPRSQRLAIAWLVFASLMRWNSLAATFAPMLLLFRGAHRHRYLVALVTWFAISAGTYEANDLMTTKREYFLYWSTGYEDIAGTLEYMPDMDDAKMLQLLDGIPLVYRDHLKERFHKNYNPISHYHLMRDSTKLFEIAHDDKERAAIAAAWKRIVLGNFGAYLRYRWDNWCWLVTLSRSGTGGFSNVYVWFNVIAAPQVIDELQHDASASHLQSQLMRASIWISLTPLYWVFLYLGLLFVLLPLCRDRLELAIVLSGIGYQLQWFFLAQTADLRYSQWMIVCSLVSALLIGYRLLAARRS